MFWYSNPRIRLTQSDATYVGLYVFWVRISRRFQIWSQNHQIPPVWPDKCIFLKSYMGKTWFVHSRCSNRYKCEYCWYTLVPYVWIIFQKTLWHILVWLLWYNQMKHFLPFHLLYVHPISNLEAQAWNTPHSMYKVWIRKNYREIQSIGEGTYKIVFKCVIGMWNL